MKRRNDVIEGRNPVSGPKWSSNVRPIRQTQQSTLRIRAWWGPWLGVGIVVALLLVPEILATPIAYGVFALLSDAPNHAEFVKWVGTTTGNAWFVGLTDAAILTIVGLIAYKKRSTLMGLGLGRMSLAQVFLAAMWFVAYIGLYLVVVTLLTQFVPGFNAEQERDIGFNNLQGSSQTAIVFALLVLVTPIVEEIMFRGFLFGGLRSRLPFWASTVITSIAFGVVHLSSMGSDALVWVAALDTGLLSVALCAVREYSKSLWPSIYMHAAKNLLAFVFIYLVH